MNQKVLKIVIPVVAIAVVIESLVLITKSSSNTGPVALPTSTQESTIPSMAGAEQTSLKWTVDTSEVKVGQMNELPLVLTSDKDVSIDALDLYVDYDPKLVSVNSAVNGKTFVAPSFKKVSADKGVVVMNFLVSEPSGFKLKAGVGVEVARLSVAYNQQGSAEFNLGEGTLVVENATAKVLPFNSEKLVINVSQ